MCVSGTEVNVEDFSARNGKPVGQNQRRLAFWIGIAAIAGAVFSFVMLVARPMLREYDAEKNWIRTDATVLNHRIVIRHRSGYSRAAAGGSRIRASEISYQYKFNGTTYVADRVTLDGRAVVYNPQNVVPGSPLVCYVNPDDPADATLIRNIRNPLPCLVFPVLLLLFGLGAFFSARHSGGVNSMPAIVRPSPPPEAMESGSPDDSKPACHFPDDELY